MQNGLFYIAVIFQCCLYSCIEVPVVLPTGSDPTTNQTTQNVLIEEYTGVRCQNCPAGAQLLEELKTIHGDQLIILSIHGGFFAQPTNKENKLTLDNTFGAQLISRFNQPQGYPSAMINRKVFGGQSSIFVGGSFWPGYVVEEKSKTPTIKLSLTLQHLPAQRLINIQCSISGMKDLTVQSLGLSLVVAENNIKDAQLTPTGVDTNYIHRHVMRSFVTGTQGDAIQPIVSGASNTYNYTTTYQADWNPDQLSIIAFVHQMGGDNVVIQTVEKKL